MVTWFHQCQVRTQCGVVVKTPGRASQHRLPSTSQLCDLTCLCLVVLMCKMGIITVPASWNCKGYVTLGGLHTHLPSRQWTSCRKEPVLSSLFLDLGQLCLQACFNSSKGIWSVGFFVVQTSVLSPNYRIKSHNFSTPQILHLSVQR